jgi:hypothetical protein
MGESDLEKRARLFQARKAANDSMDRAAHQAQEEVARDARARPRPTPPDDDFADAAADAAASIDEIRLRLAEGHGDEREQTEKMRDDLARIAGDLRRYGDKRRETAEDRTRDEPD